MQIRLSRNLEERWGSVRAPMTLDEFLGRFPEVPRDLSDEPVLKEYVEAFGRLLRVAQKPSACMRDGRRPARVLHAPGERPCHLRHRAGEARPHARAPPGDARAVSEGAGDVRVHSRAPPRAGHAAIRLRLSLRLARLRSEQRLDRGGLG
jgi:hypothetical protein